MSRHGYGGTVIDSYVEIKQRQGACNSCGTQYTGPKEAVKCKGCGSQMKTSDLSCVKKIPTGTWVVTTIKRGKRSDGPETST